jgi:hypothetical protein
MNALAVRVRQDRLTPKEGLVYWRARKVEAGSFEFLHDTIDVIDLKVDVHGGVGG